MKRNKWFNRYCNFFIALYVICGLAVAVQAQETPVAVPDPAQQIRQLELQQNQIGIAMIQLRAQDTLIRDQLTDYAIAYAEMKNKIQGLIDDLTARGQQVDKQLRVLRGE